MSYQKPDGLLLSKPVKRKTRKSAFLKKLERQQKDAADTAHVDAEQDPIRKAIDKAAHDLLTDVANDNRQRRVTSLRVAYARRRDK